MRATVGSLEQFRPVQIQIEDSLAESFRFTTFPALLGKYVRAALHKD